MMKLILDFARARDDVRAVVMTGSRANPTTTHDRFQDYDISYLVEDLERYRRNSHVPEYFGDIMILQNPDDMGDAAADRGTYAYLMQFMDGNRIDLTFRPVSDVQAILADSLSVVLLDKDGWLGELPPPSLGAYLPTRPTAKQFADCCNEFWWVNPYVAKGSYRDQIPYAKAMLDELLRGQMLRMLTWFVGLSRNYQATIGLAGKYLKSHLDSELWNLLERTYSDACPDHIWEALFATDELFRRTARVVASAFGLDYLEPEDAAVSAFIRRIRDEAIEAERAAEAGNEVCTLEERDRDGYLKQLQTDDASRWERERGRRNEQRRCSRRGRWIRSRPMTKLSCAGTLRTRRSGLADVRLLRFEVSSGWSLRALLRSSAPTYTGLDL